MSSTYEIKLKEKGNIPSLWGITTEVIPIKIVICENNVYVMWMILNHDNKEVKCKSLALESECKQ